MIGRQAADQPDMYVCVSVSVCVDVCARPCLVMEKLSFGFGPQTNHNNRGQIRQYLRPKTLQTKADYYFI